MFWNHGNVWVRLRERGGMKMTLGVGAWALGGGEACAGGLIGEGEVGHPLVPGLPWEGPTFGDLTSW